MSAASLATVGLLFRVTPDRDPPPPPRTDFGRAALLAGHRDLDLVLGDDVEDGWLTGWGVRDAAWTRVRVPVDAWLHRWPDGDDPAGWQALAAHLHGPIVNPPDHVLLCRDKLASQAALVSAGVPMPDVVAATAPDALEAWGAAFLKPRCGAFGRGVRRVVAGDPLPTEDGWILQRAIQPPAGLAGVSVRVLVQREVGGTWVVLPGAARVSETDPVVNHARGAVVRPVEDFGAETAAACADLSVRCAAALGALPHGEDVGELGVDLVLDRQGHPHVIEINGKPRGRLAALAGQWPERFAAAREAALLRPVRFAAWRARRLHPDVS